MDTRGRSKNALLGLMLAALPWPSPAAPSEAWSQLIAQARAQQSAGKYREAEKTFRSALDLAKAGTDWRVEAWSQAYLARVQQTLGELPAAQALYDKALALNETHNSALDAAAIRVNLSRIARTEGRVDEARVLCEKALLALRAVLPPDHPFVADALDTLASVQVALGKDPEAAATYEDSLYIREKTPIPDLKLAGTLHDFAGLQTTLARYRGAEAGYLRALRIREEKLGDTHPDVAETRLGLAVLYRSERQFSKADSLVAPVLPALIAAFGAGHARVANAEVEIGNLYEQEGRFVDAEPLLKNALSIYQNTFGAKYGQVAVVLTDLAALEMDRGSYGVAEDLCRRALDVGNGAFGPSHPEYAAILHKLALVYSREERYAESAGAHAEALAIRERSLGPNHPSVARWEMDYAAVLRKLHRKKEAGELEERAQVVLASAERESGDAYRVDIRDLERNAN